MFILCFQLFLQGVGLISIAQPLDLNKEQHYKLSVNAIDSGGRFATASVNIKIAATSTMNTSTCKRNTLINDAHTHTHIAARNTHTHSSHTPDTG